MKLSQKQTELAQCPYIEAESTAKLAASAAPPIRLITLSANGRKLDVGNETVLFRHEKTFFHPPGLFVRIKDTQPNAVEIAQSVADYAVDYVGMDLTLDGLAVESAGGDFAGTVAAVSQVVSLPLILLTKDAPTAEAGLKHVPSDAHVLLSAATAKNWAEMADLAAQFAVPLAVRGEDGDLNLLADLTRQVSETGLKDLVLDPGMSDFQSSLVAFTQLRRMALKNGVREVGYPILGFAGNDPLLAAQHIAKYAGFIVLDEFSPGTIYPLLVLRANIFTDPQKPIQVQPGLYEINHPGPADPLMVTTNFSITYFSVANELESSGLPGWLLVADAEGMSVLTAWAAGKFDAERIAKSIKTTHGASALSHHRLIIPGQVAVLMGELEEELPNWEIDVGPREAVDLPNYLRTVWG